jgi:hypothetical protein
MNQGRIKGVTDSQGNNPGDPATRLRACGIRTSRGRTRSVRPTRMARRPQACRISSTRASSTTRVSQSGVHASALVPGLAHGTAVRPP